MFSSPADAVHQCTKVRDRLEPRPDAVAVYASLFPLYCQIHDDLAATYTRLVNTLADLARNR